MVTPTSAIGEPASRQMARLGVGRHRFTPPRPPANVVPRGRLLQLLDSSDARTISVTAGAGYGKSTLLSAWIKAADRPGAWLQIEQSDNDPVRLVRAIACSLQAALPSTSLLDVARDLQPDSIDRALGSIEAELADTEPFTIVLDDVHLVCDVTASTVLDQLLDVLPPHCRIVLSGRSDPAVRTARRMISGDMTVVRADDLSLTEDETLAVFEPIADHISAETRAAFVARIDGWPAAAQSVLLAHHGAAGRTSDWSDHESLSLDLLGDYLQQEYLRTLPASDREFLLHTSVLDRLTADLCDAVLDTTGSADRLAALIRAGNAFVVPVGHTGVVRYHPLFARTLLGELRATTPEREIGLRQRAIDWFDAHDERTAVVEQAQQSNGLIDPAPWILKYVVAVIGAAELATLGRWLDAFAPEALRSSTALALASAWHALFSNQPGEMERWLATAEAIADDGPLPDGTADVPTAVAAVRMIAATGGVTETTVNARAVRSAGDGGGPWRGVAALIEAVAVHLSGAVPDSRPMFEQAEFETRGVPSAHAVVLAHLAMNSLSHNDGRAADELREALDEIDQHGASRFRAIVFVYCVKSLADARAGALDASAQASLHAESLLDGVDGIHFRAQIHHRLVLADAAIGRGDWTTADRLVRVASSRLSFEPDAVLLHEWTRRLRQRCAAHSGLVRRVDLTAAEQRVLEKLASHYTLGEIADHLYVSRNTVKTHTVSIYRKLVVSGRSEAVERANELGLLDAGHDERAGMPAR